jgi:hypothetical protein
MNSRVEEVILRELQRAQQMLIEERDETLQLFEKLQKF